MGWKRQHDELPQNPEMNKTVKTKEMNAVMETVCFLPPHHVMNFNPTRDVLVKDSRISGRHFAQRIMYRVTKTAGDSNDCRLFPQSSGD